MKKYNVKNYIRYKVDLIDSINNIELKELKESQKIATASALRLST